MARPRIELKKEVVFDLFSRYGSWYKVADELGVTHPTIYRRLSEWGVNEIKLSRKYSCK